MRCLFYTFHGSSAFYPLICVLPSYPRFTLISAFYPLIRVLPSHPRFTLPSAFYPHIAYFSLIRVLPSYPCFTLSSVRSFVRPSSAFYTFIHIRVLRLPVNSVMRNEKHRNGIKILNYRWT